MTILDLKNSIEQGVLPRQTIIFTYIGILNAPNINMIKAVVIK